MSTYNSHPVITQLKGGLGNQMFRYAAGKALAIQTNSRLELDISFLIANNQDSGAFLAREYELNIFPGITEKLVDLEKQHQPLLWRKIKRKLRIPVFSYPLYKETSFAFDPALQKCSAPLIIDGDWQSEKYFHRYEDEIRRSFCFPNLAADDINRKLVNGITEQNSISVHVRRGDYLLAYNYAIHGICSKEYYQTAIACLKEKNPDAVFYFFSNDMDWVKSELVQLTDKYYLIEGNTGLDSWKDMYLMSLCKHHIIANSSFSWWGAWLNSRMDKTVIAPKQWFASSNAYYNTKDLIPASWILI